MVLLGNNSLTEHMLHSLSNIAVIRTHTYQNNPEMLANLDVPFYF